MGIRYPHWLVSTRTEMKTCIVLLSIFIYSYCTYNARNRLHHLDRTVPLRKWQRSQETDLVSPAKMPCWNGKLDWYWMYTYFAHLFQTCWVFANSRDYVPKRTNWERWHCGTLTFSPVVYTKGSHRCLRNPSEEQRYRWIGLFPEEDKYVIDALLKPDAWNSRTYCWQSEV